MWQWHQSTRDSEPVGVISSRSGGYRVRTGGLNGYLTPKSPVEITTEMLHRRGRGIAYTKSVFAYPFRRIG
jgi:hypothetical protein